MPATAEMKKPASARHSVRPIATGNSPEAASAAMRSSTALNAGSMNGVTAPLRANASQRDQEHDHRRPGDETTP